jgi:hypothetical protein
MMVCNQQIYGNRYGDYDYQADNHLQPTQLPVTAITLKLCFPI